jgi:HK97 family phage major capsid protein
VTTYAEHIASLEATRAEKQARMKEVHGKSVAEGRSMNTGEQEEFDTIETEIKSLDADIDRTRRLDAIEKADIATAKPVSGTDKAAAPAAPARPIVSDLSLKSPEKLEPGIAMARYAMCLLAAKGNHALAFQIAEKHYPKTESVVRTLKAQAEGCNISQLMQMKATVPAGTSTDSTWALPLVYQNTFAGDFITYLRARSLIGQAQFRPVPFNVRIGGQTSGGTAGWVGQGKSKPVTKFDFNATTIPFTKVAAISVITQELARFSDPSAEALVRDSLADAVIARIDSDLFDPDVAAVANVSPAGLLNGVSPVAGPPASGVDADEIRCAILRLWAPWDTTFMGTRPAYYTTPSAARFLAFHRDALGNPSFPGVTATGGTLDGVPIRTSQYLANNGGSGGVPFILVDEAEIFLADDGGVTLDASEQATIEMTDAPVGSSSASVTSNGSPFVSMWQTNSIAFRAERFIWWGPRRSGAVQWIDGFPIAC